MRGLMAQQCRNSDEYSGQSSLQAQVLLGVDRCPLPTGHWPLLHDRNKFLAMNRTFAGRSPSRRMK
jgi:hypothetical protein